MDRRPFPDSSVIASAGHDPARRILQIEFRSGRVYAYFSVPPQTYTSLCTAPSAGGYFNRMIRNRFGFQEVEG